MIAKKPLKIICGLVLLAGGLWLFRYQLSFGPYFANYEIIVTDTLRESGGSGAGKLMFGSHSFMSGAFQGNAVNIGVSVPIPDSAVQEFGRSGYYDPKFEYVDERGDVHYNGPPVVDPPSIYVKVPVRSRLPKRSPFQKYAFHFTLYPRDSIALEILLLDKGDCNHIPPTAKTAILGSGPCSY